MATDARAAYDAVAAELAGSSAATTGQMFGMPSLKHGTKAFAGFYQDAMIFKLTGAAHAEALALPGARLFDPMGGRPMKEWVAVPAEQSGRWIELAHAALRYVAGAH